MALGVSAWAIRRPLPTVVVMVLVVLLGCLGWCRLPIQAMPTVVIPLVQVTVVQAGASPGDLETQVTRRIEASLSSVAGMKRTTSTMRAGVSTTIIEFQLDVPQDRALADVRDAVGRVRGSLPATIHDPVIERMEMMGLPILTYAVGGHPGGDGALSAFIDDELLRDLQSISGVGAVRRDGGVDREWRVVLRPERLAALGISADQVDMAVRGALADLPGGRQDGPGQERLVRVRGSAGLAGPADVAERRVALGGGRQVRLGDVATVEEGASEPTVLARLDGRPVVSVSIFRAKNASEVSVATAVQQRLAALQERYPWLTLRLVVDQVQSTRDTFTGALSALVEGAALAVLVVLLFLRDVRATLIAAIAIPLSVVPTFGVMWWCGFSLNGISLLAISLVAGVLVDDAIVEIENIARARAGGLPPYRAALAAADRIGLAVVATTLVIVAVFIPVSAMPGIAGKFFLEFGVTIAVAVLFSLLVARLVTPLLAAYFLGEDTHHTATTGVLQRAFAGVLEASLAHRWTTISVGVLVFIGCLALVPRLPTGFFSATDRSQSTLQVEFPAGMALREAERRTDLLRARVAQEPEVRAVFARIEVPKTTLSISLVPPRERRCSPKQFEARVMPDLVAQPDARIGFLGENGTKEVQIQVLGDDAVAVERTARALAEQMRGLPQVANITLPSGQSRPEVAVTLRAADAAALGVDAQGLARVVRGATTGDDAQVLAQVPVGNRLVPVRVVADPALRDDPERVRALRVPVAGGGSVPLAAVAEVAVVDGPASIERSDRQRRMLLEADLRGASGLGEALKAAAATPAWSQAPRGVRVVPLGDSEAMADLFFGFAVALGTGVVCVYLVLALLYGDFLHPVTIMASLPMAVGGAVVALWATGHGFDLSSLIGMMVLLGIVAKNAILVVDEALQRLHEGEPRRQALRGAALARARPIVMTTLAMIAGVVPVLFGLTPDAAFRLPMSWVLIGGLISSTLLSLVFVPAVFSVIDDLRGWLVRQCGRWVNRADAD